MGWRHRLTGEVKVEAVDDFCDRQKDMVKKVVYEGAFHELFIEADVFRAHAIRKI